MDGDKVTPVYAFDDTALNRVMPVCQVLRFPNVMDADTLRTSLETLLGIGDWRKLRGRWRLDASGKLFIQVPATATQERPAIRFKHTELATPIEAHPLVSQIARPPSDSCSVQVSLSSAAELWPVLIPPRWPQNMSDLTDQTGDHPILGLHVMSLDKMNFSGAVKRTHAVGEQGSNADGKQLAQAGRPDYIEALVQLPGPPPGPNFIQGAIDVHGNRTICTFLSSAMWPKMEESLKKLDQLAGSD